MTKIDVKARTKKDIFSIGFKKQVNPALISFSFRGTDWVEIEVYADERLVKKVKLDVDTLTYQYVVLKDIPATNRITIQAKGGEQLSQLLVRPIYVWIPRQTNSQ